MKGGGPLELIVSHGSDRHVHPLPKSGHVELGRSETCTVRLEHAGISRHHVRLYIGSQLEVEDLGSANGTWLYRCSTFDTSDETAQANMNRRLNAGERVPLASGDTLRIGPMLVELRRTSGEDHQAASQDDGFLVKDRKMLVARDLAAKAATSALPVLILGETGVGKDVLASFVHAASSRRKAPFVRVNCAALSESLLESELFGHVRGSFTGATDAKEGLIEGAHGGTLFLDELGELSLSTQARLLHVLERSEVTRLGSTKPRSIDVRFVAATNRNLVDEVKRGAFRKDLYYRVNTLVIEVPPLRERPDDILPMAQRFVVEARRRSSLPELANPIAEESFAPLLEHSWPGNVRELRNVMQRAVVLAGSAPIRAQHLSLADDFGEESVTVVKDRDGFGPAGHDEEELERVARVLAECGGNQTRAAEMLGISRRTMVNRMRELSLPRPRRPRFGSK
jgi:two-component system, NtrC family, response regulator AtoC